MRQDDLLALHGVDERGQVWSGRECVFDVEVVVRSGSFVAAPCDHPEVGAAAGAEEFLEELASSAPGVVSCHTDSMQEENGLAVGYERPVWRLAGARFGRRAPADEDTRRKMK